MTEIESPLGKKTFNAGARKVFTVTDESDYPEIPDESQVTPVTRGMNPNYKNNEQRSHDPSLDFLPDINTNPHIGMHQPQMPPQPQHQQIQKGDKVLSREEALAYLNKKEKSLSAKRTLSPMVKKRLEYLTNLCRLQDHFEIDGVKFSIQTLKSGELREITKSVMANDIKSVDFVFELRAHTVARTIYAIDDYPIDAILGTDDMETKLAFVDELDENVIVTIHKKYEKLVQSGKEKFGLETEDQVKEVVEAVKK